jgi:hypothetical protein
MKAKYCKSKRTYTNECNCEDTAKCPDYWKQGIGSLIEGGVSVVTNEDTTVTSNDSSGALPSSEVLSNVTNTSSPRTTSSSNG